jgi:hypothetical protein
MIAPPAGIPETDWLAAPASDKILILARQQEIQALRKENEEHCGQLTSLATELASLRERIGRNSRNYSKPPSRGGQGFKPPLPIKVATADRVRGEGSSHAARREPFRCGRILVAREGHQVSPTDARAATIRWGPARNSELPHPPDVGVVLHGGIVRLNSSRQQQVLFCTPSGVRKGRRCLPWSSDQLFKSP